MGNHKEQICYVGLGSNIEQPKKQILKALKSLADLESSSLLRSSSLYLSKPHGPQDQPDFINAVAKITTILEPLELLDRLQAIEQAQYRVKTRFWGERTMDLDILLYAQKELVTERLCIPHKQMLQREFVLIPLLEIEPLACLPSGELLSEYAKKLNVGLEKISQPPKIRA